MDTGEIRRLPYQGLFSAVGSCFLPGRREVIATGFSLNGHHELILMNLEDGTYTVYQHPLLERGLAIMGKLSLDGSTVAMLQQVPTSDVLHFQLVLLDWKTGAVKTVGVPGCLGAPLDRLPDGSGVILKRFGKGESLTAVEPRIICRLDLDGSLTDLKPGDSPVVLRKEERLLYEAPGSRKWRMCDLDGADDKPLPDSLEGFGQAAVSPDESSILFRRGGRGDGPQLYRFNLENGNLEAIETGEGFYGQPVWR